MPLPSAYPRHCLAQSDELPSPVESARHRINMYTSGVIFYVSRLTRRQLDANLQMKPILPRRIIPTDCQPCSELPSLSFSMFQYIRQHLIEIGLALPVP